MNDDLKKGDRVIILTDEDETIGKCATVNAIDADDFDDQNIQVEIDGVSDEESYYYSENQLELITKKKTFMSTIKDKLKALTLGEPNKTYNKAKLMDVDGYWSDEVHETAKAMMIKEFMDTEAFHKQMKTLADSIISEDK